MVGVGNTTVVVMTLTTVTLIGFGTVAVVVTVVALTRCPSELGTPTATVLIVTTGIVIFPAVWIAGAGHVVVVAIATAVTLAPPDTVGAGSAAAVPTVIALTREPV